MQNQNLRTMIKLKNSERIEDKGYSRILVRTLEDKIKAEFLFKESLAFESDETCMTCDDTSLDLIEVVDKEMNHLIYTGKLFYDEEATNKFLDSCKEHGIEVFMFSVSQHQIMMNSGRGWIESFHDSIVVEVENSIVWEVFQQKKERDGEEWSPGLGREMLELMKASKPNTSTKHKEVPWISNE